ncbi:SpaH/EbpB family LPXTG-anchored major pilin [Jeotgalibaca porci]|uniref:SpaH/EbpB family LPXTG-anchored major pilin n=1 Tax=Jeotgalibaca porci TaxID=1868793 RepID=A0A6G7WJ53_9LACT|nr:SpaH/EbpB family LPXTG-anchored major pilin [Jeotgalibaca porci]QIK52304.1 SpaH/EbpB family LPXTG-anchored major pilin [Jeotgalibaca porci]
MDNRIRYLDKLLVWMMSFVMLVPTLLGFVGSLTTYAAASTDNRIVDAVLYEGPDGFATVQAVHDPEAQKIDWTVTLNKDPTPIPTYLQFEIDILESGLQTPINLSAPLFSETKDNITLIKATDPTLEGDTAILTFSTAIADSTDYEFSLNMLVQVVGDETSLATIQTSPLVKKLNFVVPQPLNQVEQESSEIITSAPEEEVTSEESLPPAEEESASEIIEEQPSQEVAESEDIPEQESSAPEEKPNEVIHPPLASPEEPKPQPEVKPEPQEEIESEEVTELEEETFDPTIAEPVPKSYISNTFPIPFIPVSRMLRTTSVPGSVSVNKTAEACEGCRTYEVTLDITGVPPVKPVDVVLILDKSGSMSDSYSAITSSPSTNTYYYVRVNGNYIRVSYNYGNWQYVSSGNRRYVSWSATGDDSLAGSTQSNSPVAKRFYQLTAKSRMDALKEAAITFSGMVLAANTSNRVAVVQYDGPSTTTGSGNQNQASLTQNFTNNINNVSNAINGLNPVNGTNTQAGLIAGYNAFTNANPQNPTSKKVAILFTDGLPTASIGYQYNESTNPNTIHYTNAINAATNLKNYGSLFSIGLTTGMTGDELTAARYFLNQTQNAGFYEAPTAAQLQTIFNSIYTQINNYGTNGVVTDVIGDDFDLVAGSLPAGATYDAATRTITWNIGTLSGNPTLTYKVKAKDSVIGSEDVTVKLPTNKVAELTYTDVDNNPNQKLTFPVPSVHVPRILEITTTNAEILLGDSIQLGMGTDPAANNYLNITGGTGQYTYAWYLGNQTTVLSTDRNPTFTPTSETTYRVVVTDAEGCTITGYITVKIKTGQLIIHKKDEEGKLILNNPATFILSKSGSQDLIVTTGNTGIATFTGLGKGTYTLKETIAPNGYVLDSTIYTVVVESTGGQVTVTVTDATQTVIPSNPLVIVNKIATISIPVQKFWVDNDNDLNARPTEVVVQIYQNSTYMIGKDLTLTQGLDGLWKGTFTDLPRFNAQGEEYEYTIKEVPVANYESVVADYEITNTLKIGSLTITKLGENETLLDGAEFELQEADGTVAKDIQGNELTGITVDGVLSFNNLPFGTYTLVETKAPDGYELTDQTWIITITEENQTNPHVTITVTNKRMQTLPSTGGPGTILFTLIGVGLMLVAGISFSQTDRKGRNKMNRITKIFTTLLMALIVMMGAIRPIAAVETAPGPPSGKPTTADLVIHKLQFNGQEIPNIENHDGTEITIPNTSGLAGVTFDIYKVADDETSKTTPVGAPSDTGITTAGGLLTFEDLPMGRYLVVEDVDTLPHGVNYNSPNFLVDVPMTNAAGTGWLNPVHVYPKNRLVLATVDFYKAFEEEEGATATFGLYDAETDALLEEETLSANGKVIFTNDGDGYETGSYYVKEISVGGAYGLDSTEFPVAITNADHDTTLNDNNATVHANNAETPLMNYIITEPEKTNTDDDNDDFSANLGEIVNWNIDVRLPMNIEDYTMYKFTDTLDSRLDYVGNVEISIDGLPVTGLATITEPTTTSGGTLIIDFDLEKLAEYAGDNLKISFNTKINETALMGQEIPNNFVLDFDNGSEIDSKTMEEPPFTQTGGAMFDKTSTRQDLEDFSGAQFWVYRMNGDDKEYLQADRSWSTATDTPFTLTSLTDGTFKIEGLSFGTYYLEERVALPGHMLPGTDFEFDVTANTYNAEATVPIQNRPRIDLPSTGGMGTILFTIAGVGLMAGAVKLYKKEEKE